MRTFTMDLREFVKSLFVVMFRGGKLFYLWMTFLTILVIIGGVTLFYQYKLGLQLTNMREQVSWGFYISNFTFLVGVAAAAVLLIIPAYIYHFKSIKKIVVFGELMAITAVIMAMLFVFVDLGRPERIWHILPLLGSPNLPRSILAWDFVVLNGYLILNIFAVSYIGCKRYFGESPKKRVIIPLVIVSIPWAISVHTVTAFVYNGLGARAFWNASILAPRFLASAFCSGPALMIIVFQILRKIMNFEIQNKAIFKIAEIIAYAMGINLFLLLAEVYKEYYTGAEHLAPMKYLFFGLHGYNKLVPWIWTAVVFNVVGFFIFLIPRTRKNFITLNIGCVLIFIGVWIEKGMGLIIPGFIPDALGEIYEYMPSEEEILISLGIVGVGGIIYTLMVKTAVALETGLLRHPGAQTTLHEDLEGPVAKDVMTSPVVFVYEDTPVEDIGKLLVKHRISGLPVVNQEGRIIGVVSERDIIYNEMKDVPEVMQRLSDIIVLSEDEKIVKGTKAADIMTSPAITASIDTPVVKIIEEIAERNIRRVIVVDDNQKPVGVISRIDIVRAMEGGSF